MKIIIDDKIPFIKGRLEEAGIDAVYAAPGDITPQLAADADALIVRTRTRCDESLLGKSAVKLVVTATIGTDHIDLAWCREKGITVCNAAGCNAPGVAQYVWSSLIRTGFDCKRQTLGVVGLGNVGSIVADWGRRMGAKVIVCDPPRKKAGHTDFDYIPLAELIEKSDAVTLHTPLTRGGEDPTYHLIGEKELNLLRSGAILINSSRGPVVDNAAWLRSLHCGGTRAVIDVWEGEPRIDTCLMAAAAISTPHIAGYSYEGKQRATRMALEAVERYFGVTVPLDGLCADYRSPGADFPEDVAVQITASYNPFNDDALLRANPEDFERLRGSYDYRHEPAFCLPGGKTI